MTQFIDAYMCLSVGFFSDALQWRHNDHDGVSNRQPRGCLTVYSDADKRKHQSSASLAGTGEFPAQRASYAENVSIWWRHHELQIMGALIPL